MRVRALRDATAGARRSRSVGLLLALALILGCSETPLPPDQLPLGTWGGQDAGLVVTAQEVHVHLSCTKGDIAGRVPLDATGRFEVDGQHNVDAFPIDRGIYHPARYTGQVFGDDRLRLEVRLLDTGRTLGPVELFLGQEPQMRGCPICR